jgi:myosin heavy subunit
MKEQSYGAYMEKKNMKMLVVENNQLKVRLQQAEEECRKKNRLLQELVPMDGTTPMVTQAHKEASLTVSLKKKIRELEQENEGYKRKNAAMERNINLTKQSETNANNKAYEEECRRLRNMLEEAIISIHENKSLNYSELETKIIEQRMAIKELKKKVQEMDEKLQEKKQTEKQEKKQSEQKEREMVKKSQVQAQENYKQKEELDQQKTSLEEANEKIANLENLVRQLEDKLRLSQSRGEDYVHQSVEINYEANENLKTELDTAMNEKEDLKMQLQESEKKIFEKDKELREARSTAKEKEEAYILKSYEEQERLTKRIVRLELELLARRKENAESGRKPISPEEIIDIIKESQMVYAKTWMKLVLIRQKKSIEVLKDELFAEYNSNELICIKELTKILQRQPLSFDLDTAGSLSRYLIESREHPAIIYNKYNEKTVEEVRKGFDDLLDLSYSEEFWKKEKEVLNAAVKKTADQYQYLRGGVGEGNIMDLVKWNQISNSICPELSPIERDYLVNIMAEDNNLKQLDFGVLLNLMYRNLKT